MLLIPNFVFAGSIYIPPLNTVILKAEHTYKSTWTPTEEQAQRALEKAVYFLDHPTDVNERQMRELAKIKKNLSLYKVQFVGFEINGKKRIWCNFFGGRDFDGWEKKIVLVKDGGFWFWQIEYDLINDICVNFRSNGYA